MKKVFKFMAIAAVAFGLCMNVGCGKEEEGGENGGNGGNNTPVENPENLPTTLDEGFNNGIPTTWTIIDADGDGYKWMLNSEAFNKLYGVDSSNCAVSPSYVNGVGALTTDNYLVSPKIHVPSEGGYKLTYKVASFEDNYPDSYVAMVGTLENNVFTPIATLIEETVSNGMIHAVDENTVVDGDGFKDVTLSLDGVKGQDVYIAFRHHCTDAYWLILEDVKVVK